jgi:hypothetical protein
MMNDQEFSEEETARRRDVVIRTMANTPPQPRVSPGGVGQSSKRICR